MHFSNPNPCENLTDLVIDNYRLLNVVGQGGMGCVYKARDEKMGRIVALKVLRSNLGVFSSREGKALGQLNHPNIVNVFYMGESPEGVFIAMEFIDGGTLHEYIGNDPQEIIPILKQALLAVEHAHKKGVIHRDIKPSNIMVSKEDRVKVMDFGLAKVESRDQDRTITRLQAGTISYMSPEQVRGLQHVSQLSDIYSLGKTFYHILAGRLPFNSGESDQYSILKAIIERQFKPPGHYNSKVPKGLDRIIMKAIEKDPSNRYQSAREMYTAIEEFEARQKPVKPAAEARHSFTPLSNKKLVFGIAGVALLLLVTAVTAWFTNREQAPQLTERGAAISTKIEDTFSTARDPLPPESIPDSVGEPTSVSLTRLTINTFPSTSQIQLDEETFDRIQSYELQTGAYELVVTADGYDTHTDTIQLNTAEDTTLSVTLLRQGRLVVDSNVSGAQVSIDGKDMGPVPLDQPFPQGNYSLVVSALGHSPFRRQVRVRSENNVRITATFEQQRSVHIQALPAGDIYINGELQASEEVETFLSEGPYTIRVTHNEYGVWEKDIQVSDTDERVTVDFNQQVSANVGSNIWGAQIYIDGEQTEFETIGQIMLRVGIRRVEVKKEGYISEPPFIERLIEGNEDSPIQFSFQLTKAEQ